MFVLYTRFLRDMGKRWASTQTAKGKQKAETESTSKKHGRKSNLEILENLEASYVIGNSSTIRQEIRGWEREIQTYPEDLEVETEILDFITDPGNTRGRLTSFHQKINTYWILKCLLAKAMQSFPPAQVQQEQPKIDTSLKDMLQDMQNQLYHIKITQYQAADRISRVDDRVGRIEKQL